MSAGKGTLRKTVSQTVWAARNYSQTFEFTPLSTQALPPVPRSSAMCATPASKPHRGPGGVSASMRPSVGSAGGSRHAGRLLRRGAAPVLLGLIQSAVATRRHHPRRPRGGPSALSDRGPRAVPLLAVRPAFAAPWASSVPCCDTVAPPQASSCSCLARGARPLCGADCGSDADFQRLRHSLWSPARGRPRAGLQSQCACPRPAALVPLAGGLLRGPRSDPSLPLPGPPAARIPALSRAPPDGRPRPAPLARGSGRPWAFCPLCSSHCRVQGCSRRGRQGRAGSHISLRA